MPVIYEVRCVMYKKQAGKRQTCQVLLGWQMSLKMVVTWGVLVYMALSISAQIVHKWGVHVRLPGFEASWRGAGGVEVVGTIITENW